MEHSLLMEEAAFELNFYGRVRFDWHLGGRTSISESTELQNCFLCLELEKHAKR